MVTVAAKSNEDSFVKDVYNLGVRHFRVNMDYPQQASSAIVRLHSLNIPDSVIFADFQGPKMRLKLDADENNLRFVKGDELKIYYETERFPHISNLNYLLASVKVGNIISFADNKISAKIETVEDDYFLIKFTQVEYVLRQNAGCVISGDGINVPHMTKDICTQIAKSEIVQKRKVDWVILSFVKSAIEIKSFVCEMHKIGIKVMAKVETAEGVRNIREISRVVDGIMLGRGDLKNTTKEQYGLFLNMALSSLSEVGDVFKGVGTFFLSHFSNTGVLLERERKDVERVDSLGLDFIMLSKEVVNSKFPIETVELLNQIINE